MAPKMRGSGLPSSQPRRSGRLRRIGPDSGPPTSAAAPQVLEDSTHSVASSAAPLVSDGDHTPPSKFSIEAALNQAYRDGTLHQVFKDPSSASSPSASSEKSSSPIVGSSRKRKMSSSSRAHLTAKKRSAPPGPRKFLPKRKQSSSPSAICKDAPSSVCFVSSQARNLYVRTTCARPCVFERPFDFTSLPPLFESLIARLGWTECLSSLPRANLSLVREFYANFPESLPVTMDLFTSSVPPP